MRHVPVVPSPIFSLSAAFRPLCTQYGDYPKTPVLKPGFCAEIFSKPILIFLLCGLPKILLLGKFSYRQMVGSPSPVLLFLLCTRILLCTPFLLFALFFLYSLLILCPLLLDILCSFFVCPSLGIPYPFLRALFPLLLPSSLFAYLIPFCAIRSLLTALSIFKTLLMFTRSAFCAIYNFLKKCKKSLAFPLIL